MSPKGEDVCISFLKVKMLFQATLNMKYTFEYLINCQKFHINIHILTFSNEKQLNIKIFISEYFTLYSILYIF